jgi:hypothetical protein
VSAQHGQYNGRIADDRVSGCRYACEAADMFLVIMGAAFAIVGAVVDVAVLLNKITPSLAIMGTIFLVVGVVLVIVGALLVRGARRRAELLAHGQPGTARISSVRQTSIMVNNQPVLDIRLAIQVSGRPEYPASVRQVVPFIRLAQVQPGGVLAVKVDPKQPERLAIDWDTPVGPGTGSPGAPAVPTLPGAPAIPTLPGGAPAIPTLPDDYAANLPADQLREQVRATGATGRAIIDAVHQVGPQGDKMEYLLGMWVQLDSGPAYRLDNAPATVEVRYAARVRPGVTVPLRTAQVPSGVTMTVLEWDKLP